MGDLLHTAQAKLDAAALSSGLEPMTREHLAALIPFADTMSVFLSRGQALWLINCALSEVRRNG